jgi:hypothetical protein
MRLLESIQRPIGYDLSLRQIQVIRPIQTQWIELSTKRGIKRALVLTDVAYVLVASLIQVAPFLSAEPVQFPLHKVTTKKKAHFGLHDFPCELQLLGEDEKVVTQLAGTGKIDLGWSLFDIIDIGKARARFWRGCMTDGIIHIPEEPGLVA